jgi:uncharacterized protein (TIGR00369 family)
MKDMDRWLGDGGMELISALGARFNTYGVNEELGVELGWVLGTWSPLAIACNPHGIVQAGVHCVVLDAAMNFACNACLDGRDRTKATLEMKTETMRMVRQGDSLAVSGKVIRISKQIAFVEAQISQADAILVSRSTGTFLLHREDRS